MDDEALLETANKLYIINRREKMPRIIQIKLKLTRDRKNNDKARAKVKSTFMTLLTESMEKAVRDRRAPIPKKIPTLFQLPIIVEERSGNTPKDNTLAPNTRRVRRKRERSTEDPRKIR